MYTSQNTLSISDLRKNTLDVLEKLEEVAEPITIFSHSKPVAVMMSMTLYERIQNNDSNVDSKRSMKALEFFISPPKKFIIKKHDFDPVKAIRQLRD